MVILPLLTQVEIITITILHHNIRFRQDTLHIYMFNVMVIRDFLPTLLLYIIIVPLLKDKQDDVTDHDNYMLLAITCVASKKNYFVILHRYRHLLSTTANQFGFKETLSTDVCVLSLKQVIEYYSFYNRPVYLCYLDASKAF